MVNKRRFVLIFFNVLASIFWSIEQMYNRPLELYLFIQGNNFPSGWNRNMASHEVTSYFYRSLCGLTKELWENKKTKSQDNYIHCFTLTFCFLLPSHQYNAGLKVIWKKTPRLYNIQCLSHDFSRITFIWHNWFPKGGSLSSTYCNLLVSIFVGSLSTVYKKDKKLP